jgi:hypothetical protein
VALISALRSREESTPSHGDSSKSESPGMDVVRSLTLVPLRWYDFGVFRVVMLYCWENRPPHLKECSVFVFRVKQSSKDYSPSNTVSHPGQHASSENRCVNIRSCIMPYSLRPDQSNDIISVINF